MITILLAIYSIFIVAASLLGGWLPRLVTLTQRNMQLLMCLVAGLMLGVAILHLMPHAFVFTRSIDATAYGMLAGLLLMWALVRLFHFHQHVAVDEQGHIEAVACGHDHGHEHHHHHDHAVHEPAPALHQLGEKYEPLAPATKKPLHKYSWVGVAFGLALHTLIDGVAVGAAVLAEKDHGGIFPFLGVGVFLAVMLHKPMDSLAITALMHATGWSEKAQTLVNLGFSAMAPLGAFSVLMSAQFLAENHWLIGGALAFSAGVFLWISLGDLLPDVHFHSNDAPKFAAALLLGVAIAWGIGYLEPEHSHETPAGEDHGHSHSHSHSH
jgi:zinc and cadmium transporter